MCTTRMSYGLLEGGDVPHDAIFRALPSEETVGLDVYDRAVYRSQVDPDCDWVRGQVQAYSDALESEPCKEEVVEWLLTQDLIRHMQGVAGKRRCSTCYGFSTVYQNISDRQEYRQNHRKSLTCREDD